MKTNVRLSSLSGVKKEIDVVFSNKDEYKRAASVKVFS
jgi:hypothetical protein